MRQSFVSTRIGSLGLGSFLLMGFLACGGGGSSTSPQVSNNPSQPTAAPTPTPTPASNLPVIASFGLDHAGVSLGDTATFRWTVSNADRLNISPGVGDLSAKAITNKVYQLQNATAGSTTYTLTATNIHGSSTAQVKLVSLPAAKGLSSDRPPFVYERNGVFSQPWGAAGMSWPEQIFWQNVGQNSTQYNEMIQSSAGVESAGLVPSIGAVAWGYEYTAATGGDANTSDWSQRDGFKQWGQWMKDPNHAKYYSTKYDGTAEPGYITPMMPMDAADWPTAWGPWPFATTTGTTWGQWLGHQLTALALNFNYRGLFCADYVIGLEWGDAIDFNPRVMDDFAAWAGVTVPAGTITERAEYIESQYKPLWLDYKCTRFATFYTSYGNGLLAAGKTPLIGGQIGGIPPWTRGSANDFRIYKQGLPGKYWYYNVELQSDALRPVPEVWWSSICMGATVAKDPEMHFGAHMDGTGGQQQFDISVKNGGKDKAWAEKYLKHHWLSVGWTHVAGVDGTVRRAPEAFLRSYWDASEVDPALLLTLFDHIPKHPFGPAFYYTASIERSFENVISWKGNNYWMSQFCLLRELDPIKVNTRRGNARGLCLGYYVSDLGIDHLAAADKPTGWIVYDSNRLPADEKNKLLALAPIYDIDAGRTDPDGSIAASLLAAGPIHFDQAKDQCINGLAFVDQNGSVIVMITNALETDGAATMVFSNVGDGSFDCNGLLGTPSAKLTIKNGAGSVAIKVPARETLVFEIPKLKWNGH